MMDDVGPGLIEIEKQLDELRCVLKDQGFTHEVADRMKQFSKTLLATAGASPEPEKFMDVVLEFHALARFIGTGRVPSDQ